MREAKPNPVRYYVLLFGIPLLVIAPKANASPQESVPLLKVTPSPELRTRPSNPLPTKFSFDICPTIGFSAMAMWEAESTTLKLGGDLHFLWNKQFHNWGMGFRLAVNGSVPGTFDYLNIDTGFLIKARWFWSSGGPSILFLDQKSVIPALNISIGLDVPLADRLAIRFQASVTTVIMFIQGYLGGGLVVRF